MAITYLSENVVMFLWRSYSPIAPFGVKKLRRLLCLQPEFSKCMQFVISLSCRKTRHILININKKPTFSKAKWERRCVLYEVTLCDNDFNFVNPNSMIVYRDFSVFMFFYVIMGDLVLQHR